MPVLTDREAKMNERAIFAAEHTRHVQSAARVSNLNGSIDASTIALVVASISVISPDACRYSAQQGGVECVREYHPSQ